jgi:two-component system KDP operon response regulator KdpE
MHQNSELTATPRILIVDDDAQFRRALRLGLASHGYEVEDAAWGEQGLAAVADRVPDLIVLDWQLPGIDGIHTCRVLRMSCDAPVIMISGNRSNSNAAALAAGAIAYLAKPFSIDELLTLIRNHLNARVHK